MGWGAHRFYDSTVDGSLLREARQGRFAISQFQAIRLQERLRRTNSGELRRVGRVFLVGRAATPEIEVLSEEGDVAEAAARELGEMLGLECITTSPAGVVQKKIVIR